MTSFLILVLGLVSLVSAQGRHPIVADGFAECQKVSKLVSTTFSDNLITALENLILQSSAGAWKAMTVVGVRDQNKVSATFLCKVNISAEHCKRCTINAISRLRNSNCLDPSGFHITMEDCFLRYDSHLYGMGRKMSNSTKLTFRTLGSQRSAARPAARPAVRSQAGWNFHPNSQPNARSSPTIFDSSMSSSAEEISTEAAQDISGVSSLDSIERDQGFHSLRCPNRMATVSTGFFDSIPTALTYLKSISSAGAWHARLMIQKRAKDNVYASLQCRLNMSENLFQHCKEKVAKLMRKNECPLSVLIHIRIDGCFRQYRNHFFFSLNGSSSSKTDSVVVSEIEVVSQQSLDLPAQPPSSSHQEDPGLSQLRRAILQDYYAPAPAPSEGYDSPPAPLTSENSPAQTPPAPPQPTSWIGPPAPPTGRHTGTTIVIVVVVVVISCVVIAIIVIAVIWFCCMKRKVNGKPKEGPQTKDPGSGKPSALATDARAFSLKDIEKATNKFDMKMELGRGGFGTVYRGILPSGEEVAIKKLKTETSGSSWKEFLNEAHIIQKVQHRNLIRLFGVCQEAGERILVYEYMPNGSLYDYLKRNDKVLNWSDRYQIIMGIAKGLAYLHEESHYKIVHGDIKPQNILLNDGLQAVIADFGISNLLQDGSTQVITTPIGTRGYLPQEYIQYGELRPSVDSYSFGVVCLDIICGGIKADLINQAWRMYEMGMSEKIVDERIQQDYSAEEVDLVLQIAFLCLDSDHRRRPAMSTVVSWLLRKSTTQEVPRSPGFNSESRRTPSERSSSIFTSSQSRLTSSSASSYR